MGKKIIAYILALACLLTAPVPPVQAEGVEPTAESGVETVVEATAETPAETVEETERPAPEQTPEEAAPTEKLELQTTQLRIGVGETATLLVQGTGLRFSSDSKSASVSAEGAVKGVKKGAAVITVQAEDGSTAQCRVEVYPAPKKVTVSSKKKTMAVGESGKITYSLPEGTAGSVCFSSDHPEIVSVDEHTGEITAHANGTAKILVKTYNAKKAVVTVKVVNAPQSIALSQEALTLGVGQQVKLSAKADNGATGGFVWRSVDEGILACENGELTGVSAGETEVVVETYNGVTASCKVIVVEAPQQVELAVTEATIGVGESFRLEAFAGEGVAIDYRSSKSRIASVDADGKVKGLRKGTVEITASTYNGQAAVCRVTVLAAPAKVQLRAKTMEMGVGEQLALEYKLSSGAAGEVRFESSNPDVVSVDERTGEMTARAIGTAKVRVKTYNGRTAQTVVTVRSAPQQLMLSEEAITIGSGESHAIAAKLDAGAAGAIHWESTDETVAVCENGAITARTAGTAEIIARTYNGLEARCAVTVTVAPQKIILPETSITIGVGESVQLSPEVDAGESDFAYRSGRTKYVRVSADGVVRGVSKGTAIVYVRTYNGVEAQCRVTVKAAPKKIELKDTQLELGAGEQYELLYRLSANSAGTVRFSSSNESVARVDAAGRITAGQTGSAVITAMTYNGKTAQCHVQVYAAPDSISVNAQQLTMGVGQNYSLKAVLPDDTRSQIHYQSSNPAAAEVSASGEIMAKAAGSTTIRIATFVPDVFAEVSVRVMDAPTSLSLGAEEFGLYIGEELQLSPAIPAGSYSAFDYGSSNPAVATVTADGTVRALSRGTTLLTVSTYNGLTAQAELRVWDRNYPDEVRLLSEPPVIELDGGDYALEFEVFPAEAAGKIEWRSSNAKAAVIDQQGVITPKGYGFAQITAVSKVDGTVLLEFTLTVQMENLSLTVPARTTTVSGISANLAKIDRIRRSAIRQVDAMREGGVISAADAAKRRSIINNVFEDYAFAWMTETRQPYWKAANSDGGVKDFKPGTVYYGMPYTSGVAKTRQYNFAKALSESRFVDSGSGYYLLNQNNLMNGQYVGNDCSALVNAAIWGVNDRHVYDRTSRIAVSTAYRTLKDPKELRPGDLLCRSGRHVVMFLYYANPEKTKIMIIENGGKEWGVNTVHCSVHDISDYLKDGYIGRRLATLDK